MIMTSCERCRSYAINPHLHGRDDSDKDLCDVCYWRKRAEAAGNLLAVIHRDGGHHTEANGLLDSLLDAEERVHNLIQG